jgi:hypothetical protein
VVASRASNLICYDVLWRIVPTRKLHGHEQLLTS